MNRMICNLKNTTALISFIILLIFSILMTVIFTNYIMSRKYETAVLTMREMITLLIVEAIYQVRTIILWGIGIATIFAFCINFLANFDLIVLNIGMIFLIVAISILTIIIPTLVSAIIVNKNKPSKVLRN